ncbi:MAG: tetratricopeptide repeat protein [Planctomycetes bacterium]|nr:tetratricopeptide repeat protein [Planctomycetota bacterium]
MSYLLEILGRGLLADLKAAFRDLLRDDTERSTTELEEEAVKSPESKRRWAIRLLEEKQFSRARDVFSQVIDADPSNRVGRVGLACCLDELGLTRAAIEQLHNSFMGNPKDSATLFAIGFCAEKVSEIEDATVAYEAALEEAPQLRNAHERLAAIHFKQDNVDGAITHYEHLSWCEPADLNASITLANLYVRAERFDDAIRQYQVAITIDPDNWDAQDDLVSACTDAGRYDEAIGLMKSLITKRPECADQYLRLGDLYNKTGRETFALDAYRNAVERHPEYLEAVIKVGTSNLRGGDYVEAAKSFSQAIEINDRVLSAYVGMGVAQQASGRIEEAKESFEMAGGIEPNSTLLFSEVARLQLKVSAAEQTKKYLSPTAVALAPQGPPDEFVSSLIERQIDNLGEAIHRHPNHADLQYRLGLLLRQQGDLSGAIEAYANALRINPQYFKALLKLSLALRESGDLRGAMDAAKRALQIDPESVTLHYQLGVMFSDQNEFSLAVERFDFAVKNDPKNVDYLSHLILALQNMGLLDRATETGRMLSDVSKASADGGGTIRDPADPTGLRL